MLRRSLFLFYLYFLVSGLLLEVCAAPHPAPPDFSVSVSVEDPDPYVWEATDLYYEIGENESFVFEVEATNRGGPAEFASIAFSFPALDELGDEYAVDVEVTDGGTEYNEYEAGSTIYNRQGEEITAEYLLVELAGEWEAGETRRLEVEVTPSDGEDFSTGRFPVNWRVTIGKETFPPERYANDTDQQGWPVKQPYVDVEEATGDLHFVVENVEGGSEEVPRENGEVIIIDEDGNKVDEKRTDPLNEGDGKGEVTFEDLDPDEDYQLQVYHEPDETPLASREFWGKVTDVSVSSGEPEKVTFTRYQPYLLDLQVFNPGGENVTGQTVRPGVTYAVKLTVMNEGAAQEVQTRLVLDRDKQSENGAFDYERTSQQLPIATGDTRTFTFEYTPREGGEVYRTYLIEGFIPSDFGPTGAGAWWDQPLLTVEENEEPTASMSTSPLPSSLYPNRKYTFRTTYEDGDGASDIETTTFRLDRSQASIELRHDPGSGEDVEVVEGEEYVQSKNVDAESDGKVHTVGWSISFEEDWPSNDSGIEYVLGVEDQGGKSDQETAIPEEGVAFKDYGTTVLVHGLQTGPTRDLVEWLIQGLGYPRSVAEVIAKQLPGQYDDRLSRWPRDAACFIRKRAGAGKILVYNKQSGDFVSPGELEDNRYYRHYDDLNRFCPEMRSSNSSLVPMPPQYTKKGEDILIFDWTTDSNDRGLGFSEAAASALYAALKQRESDGNPIAPVHFIGHSRGTTVISEVSERLVASGHSVDQATYLDTHDWGWGGGNGTSPLLHSQDVNPGISSISFPDWTPKANGKRNVGAIAWSSVGWTESYWQSNATLDVSPKRYQRGNCADSFLNGRPVEGAFSRNWSDQIEQKPDESEDCDLGHSGVYREYIRSIEGTSEALGGYRFSRIGGYPHRRPNSAIEGNVKAANFNFASLGHGIVNGDFQRGNATNLPGWCGEPEGCIPGWTHHGGGGTSGTARAELWEAADGKQMLEIGYTDAGGNQGILPSRSMRRSDRFYVPENATNITLRYKFNSRSVTGNPDQFHVDIGRPGNFEEVLVTSQPSEEPDEFHKSEIPVSSQRGYVSQIRLRVTNSTEDVASTVYVDNVRMYTSENPLPVELATFDSRVSGEAVILSWKTASETNNAGFEVQHRPDSTAEWEKVGFVSSEAQGGTTNQSQSYKHRIDDLEIGAHSFRLRQVDNDGSTSFTDPVRVQVTLDGKYQLSAYPNPVRRQATVEIAAREEQKVQVMLYDVLGRLVATLYDGPMPSQEMKTLTLNTRQEGLSSGTYFLRLMGEEGTRTSQLTVVR